VGVTDERNLNNITQKESEGTQACKDKSREQVNDEGK
jgi:hypothetical protein